MITFSVERITPDIARVYLSLQDPEHKNRRIRQSTVQKYARMMRDGEWALTHQGIAFGKDGYLRDGQHRLNAIILSGVGVDMTVARGLESNSYYGIDTGDIRSWQDMVRLTDANARQRRIDRERLYLGTQNAIWNFVNNTPKRTIKIPKVPRYDVSKKLLQVLEGEE